MATHAEPVPGTITTVAVCSHCQEGLALVDHVWRHMLTSAVSCAGQDEDQAPE